jgi:folate-dependent phosphoribosylglycinamide formyltransferase PurN
MSPYNIKVIILAGRGESTTLMVNALKDCFSIQMVVVESPVQKKHLLRLRLKRLGLTVVIGQVLFMAYIKIWLRRKSQTRINEIINYATLDDGQINSSMVFEVDSINSKEVICVLQKHRPDVVVVNGTRIIKKEIIEAINVPFINTHVGITPKYRGVHGAYWALTEKDIEHCGVTVHLVDTGIDTGGVLYQDVITVTEKDNFSTYPYLQTVAAIPLMKKSIIEVANKTFQTKKVDLPSKLWSHPTLMEYIKYRIFRNVK